MELRVFNTSAVRADTEQVEPVAVPSAEQIMFMAVEAAEADSVAVLVEVEQVAMALLEQPMALEVAAGQRRIWQSQVLEMAAMAAAVPSYLF